MLEVDLAAGGRAKFKDTWVRYKIRNLDERSDNSSSRSEEKIDRFVETSHDKMATLSPLYEHKESFTVRVTAPFLDHLKKGKVIFQLWGKLVEDPLPRAPGRANSTVYGAGGVLGFNAGQLNFVLPEGWRRVHAFMDPQGQLHYELPKEILENCQHGHTVSEESEESEEKKQRRLKNKSMFAGADAAPATPTKGDE